MRVSAWANRRRAFWNFKVDELFAFVYMKRDGKLMRKERQIKGNDERGRWTWKTERISLRRGHAI